MATDEELNALMSVKHIAPYRKGGLGAQGKGLGKRVKDLKSSLAGRKWGEEVWAPKGKEGAGARQQDGGYAQRNGAAGEGKKKRMGRNERKRKAAAAGLDQDQDQDQNADRETTTGANGQGQEKPMSIEEQRRALEREAAAQTVQGSAFRGGVHPSRLAQVDSTSHTRSQVLASGTADGGEEGEGVGEGKKRRKKKKKSAVA